MEIRVRIAQQSDLKLVYGWANDPIARMANIKQGMVPLDTFARLFTILLYDKDTLFLITEGLSDGAWVPIAQVRIDTDGEISLFIDSDYRGRHLAASIILEAIDFSKERLFTDTVRATIRRENIPSIKAFERAGFCFKGEVTCKGQPCVEYTRILD